MVRKITAKPTVELKDMTLRELFEMQAQNADTPAKAYRFDFHAKLLDMEEFDFDELGKKDITLLDLTPNQLNKYKNVATELLINPNSEYQKYESGRLVKKSTVKPQLSKTVAVLDQVMNKALKKTSIIKNYFESEDKDYKAKAGTGTNPGQRRYRFPTNFYETVSKKIASMQGVQKNIATLLFVGGLRPGDLAKIRIQDIDFSTGIVDTRTKTGGTYGVLSEPLLDIVREQIESTGRNVDGNGYIFAGLVTENKKGDVSFKTNITNSINKQLKEIGTVEYKLPAERDFTVKEVTMKELRHSSEQIHNAFGDVGIDRDLATFRYSENAINQTTGQKYADPFPPVMKAKEMQKRKIANISGYSGYRTSGRLLNFFGFKKLSNITNNLRVKYTDLIDEKFLGHLKKKNPAFIKMLEKTSGRLENVSQLSEKEKQLMADIDELEELNIKEQKEETKRSIAAKKIETSELEKKAAFLEEEKGKQIVKKNPEDVNDKLKETLKTKSFKDLVKKGKFGKLSAILLGVEAGSIAMDSILNELRGQDLLGVGANIYGYNVFNYDEGPQGLVVDKKLSQARLNEIQSVPGETLSHEEEGLLKRYPEHYERLLTTKKRQDAYMQEQEKINTEYKQLQQKEEMDRLLADPLGAID
jgi:integrase